MRSMPSSSMRARAASRPGRLPWMSVMTATSPTPSCGPLLPVASMSVQDRGKAPSGDAESGGRAAERAKPLEQRLGPDGVDRGRRGGDDRGAGCAQLPAELVAQRLSAFVRPLALLWRLVDASYLAHARADEVAQDGSQLDGAVMRQGVGEDRQGMGGLVDGVRHIVQGGRQPQDLSTPVSEREPVPQCPMKVVRYAIAGSLALGDLFHEPRSRTRLLHERVQQARGSLGGRRRLVQEVPEPRRKAGEADG